MGHAQEKKGTKGDSKKMVKTQCSSTVGNWRERNKKRNRQGRQSSRQRVQSKKKKTEALIRQYILSVFTHIENFLASFGAVREISQLPQFLRYHPLCPEGDVFLWWKYVQNTMSSIIVAYTQHCQEKYNAKKMGNKKAVVRSLSLSFSLCV